MAVLVLLDDDFTLFSYILVLGLELVQVSIDNDIIGIQIDYHCLWLECTRCLFFHLQLGLEALPNRTITGYIKGVTKILEVSAQGSQLCLWVGRRRYDNPTGLVGHLC